MELGVRLSPRGVPCGWKWSRFAGRYSLEGRSQRPTVWGWENRRALRSCDLCPTGADGEQAGEQRGFLESSTRRVCQLGALLSLFLNSLSWLHFQPKLRCRPSSTTWQGGGGKAPSITCMWVISWISDTCSRSRGLQIPTLPQASFAPGPQAGVWVRQELQPDVEGLSQHKDQPPLGYPALYSISKSFVATVPFILTRA